MSATCALNKFILLELIILTTQTTSVTQHPDNKDFQVRNNTPRPLAFAILAAGRLQAIGWRPGSE
jgi:hypothetical protein